MSATLACEAGQTLVAMLLVLPNIAEMPRYEPVMPEIAQNQHPQS
jgi:hypothetical protein